MSKTPALAPRATFSQLLFAVASTPPSELTDLERRLLAITKELYVNTLVFVQVEAARADPDAPIPPATDGQVARAARLAFVAAVELEKPLRDIRDALGSGR